MYNGSKERGNVMIYDWYSLVALGFMVVILLAVVLRIK
nr:MAG TPA: hypothetical protein [Bacteriophage sp.]